MYAFHAKCISVFISLAKVNSTQTRSCKEKCETDIKEQSYVRTSNIYAHIWRQQSRLQEIWTNASVLFVIVAVWSAGQR